MTLTRKGYGQVEPNQLSAQSTGQIFASLPLDETVAVLQNGEFMYYDGVAGKVTGTSNNVTEPYLVFNEEKIYTDWGTRKDFAMIREVDNYYTENEVTNEERKGTTGAKVIAQQNSGYRLDGFAPRLFKVNIGDIFTTNMVALGDYNVGDKLVPTFNATSNTLVLSTGAGTENVYLVLKTTTMPDGQPALKLQRIA